MDIIQPFFFEEVFFFAKVQAAMRAGDAEHPFHALIDVTDGGELAAQGETIACGHHFAAVIDAVTAFEFEAPFHDKAEDAQEDADWGDDEVRLLMAQFLCEIGGVFLQVVALDFEGACFQGVVRGVVAAEVPSDAGAFRQFVRVETGENDADAVHPLFVAEDVGAAAAFAASGEKRGVVAGEVGVVARDIGTHAEGEDFFVPGAEGVDLVEVAGEIHRVHHRPVFDGFFEARPVVGALRQGFFEKTGEHPPLP